MKIRLLLFALAVGVGMKMTAQVEDVSIFVTPTASYNWFDSKSTIKDGAMYGVQAGFGFGKSIELRGIYEQSSDLDQKFGQYMNDLNDLGLDFELSASDVKVRRVGGEFKANIPTGGFSPYLLIGTGVQTYKREFSDDKTFRNEHIYGSAGLGFKINISDRLTFNIEGRGFGYNMKPNSMLADPDLVGDQTGDYSYEEWMEGHKRKTMYNFSVNAGLQLYLGGNNEDLSAMDRAYKQRFGSGLSKFKVTLAPIGAYVNFDDATPYRDTYMLGGELGLEFSDFVGIRGYYLRATEDKKVNLDFDKLSMYGADFVGRLNVARGITPYLTIGGGYINASNNYIGELENPMVQVSNVSSKYYAKGGVGIDIPLGKRVDLFGAANILYTTQKDNSEIGHIENTDQLRNHIMYNTGLRIKLGKNIDTEKEIDRAFDERFDPERRKYDSQLEDYDQRIKDYDKKVKERDARIADYKDRIDELEDELKDAFERNDEKRAAEIMREKKYIEGEIRKDERPENPLIRMTPAELENLIDKVIKDVEEEENEKSVENRLERLEELLIRMNKTQSSTAVDHLENQPKTTSSVPATDGSANDRLIEEISKLQKQINEQDNTIAQLRDESNMRSQDRSDSKVEIHTGKGTSETEPDYSSSSGFNFNRGLAVFVGPSFGDATNFNIGLKSYHTFTNTSIMFTPDIYIGLGKKTAFGINANGIFPININNDFTPYAGVGVGLNSINSHLKFSPNFIVGTSYKLANSASIIFDYTVRGAFTNNQVAVGYRFRF